MNTTIRAVAATFAVVATLGAALAPAPAQAKSAHCSAVPVPGQPGHYIVVCSRVRP